jgi:hypothetical protein
VQEFGRHVSTSMVGALELVLVAAVMAGSIAAAADSKSTTGGKPSAGSPQTVMES